MKLTASQRLMLRTSATGGAHAIRPVGAGQWRVARRLADLGLGTIDGRDFTATPAGVAAVAPEGGE